MPKYLVMYTLAGGVEVEAPNAQAAEDMVLGNGEFEDKLPMSDSQLIAGVSCSHGFIDGDAIHVHEIEELEEK